jgi:cytochrome b6-f complex iron-sulfur subunit
LSAEIQQNNTSDSNPSIPKTDIGRREFFGKLLMGACLIVSYGVLLVEAFLFLLPLRTAPKTRRLFAGKQDHYEIGSVKKLYDLQGNVILVRRSQGGFNGFSSVCPHLGCRVHWQEDKNQFFCPCHNGIFDADGIAISGPPAAAHQQLETVPIIVDQTSGRVYIEVEDIRKGQ